MLEIIGLIILIFLIYCLWDVAFKNVRYSVIIKSIVVGFVLTLIIFQLFEPDSFPGITLIVLMGLTLSIAVLFIFKISGIKK
jgi:hypothetical protein